MSMLLQLLTGAKPYPIPACAIRPMPRLEAEGADDEPCKRCFFEAKNAKRMVSK